MLADAGSIPAVSTKHQTGLEPSRPVNSQNIQPLRETTYSYTSVSDGLCSSEKRHRFDTNRTLDRLQPLGTFECHRFRERILGQFPTFTSLLGAEYLRIANQQSYREANIRLRKRQSELKQFDLNLTECDSNLRLFAADKAFICTGYIQKQAQEIAAQSCYKLLKKYEIEAPKNSDFSYIANRLTNKSWWYRQVRTKRNRVLSEIERDIGIIANTKQPYSSNRSLGNHDYRKRKQAEFLEKQVLRNHHGELVTLADLARTNTSNPEIRHAEMMVRCRGFEQVAKVCGHEALFFTLTTPSRMHRSTSKNGKLNPRFDGTTPRQAQNYLCRLWERSRAALHRSSISVYGFRVAEPHHDGTPHWHMLLFVAPENKSELTKILRKYSLQDSPNERGAYKHRITVKNIDPEKGSATGYIAKYIAKNIDGKCLSEDRYGNEAKSAARRTVTWASDHGIRQFQQIGGPSVTVWRELRKLKSKLPHATAESARSAADSSDWAAFVFAMGGPSIKAQERPLRPFYEHVNAIDLDSGELITKNRNKYGEESEKTVLGVQVESTVFPTRFFVWDTAKRLKPILPARSSIDRSLSPEFASKAREPWTCVNNCTRGVC